MSTYTDAEHMTATQKAALAKAYRRFLQHVAAYYGEPIAKSSEFCGQLTRPWSVFTTALYNHLHQHCGFIAHYNRYGFYGTYFLTPEGTERFLSRMLSGGLTLWDEYQDINRELGFITLSLAPAIRGKINDIAKRRDISHAAALMQKWEGK